MAEAYFTGFGLVSPIGNTADAAFDSIRQGITAPGIVDVTLKNQYSSIPYYTIPSPAISEGAGRMRSIVVNAVQQAIDDAGLSKEQLQAAGVFVGSTSFDLFQCEQKIKEESLLGNEIAKAIPFFGALTSFVCEKFSIAGPAYTFNTACTSSSNALIYAAEFIRRGDIDHAIVLGVDFFNEVTALGFANLELISKQGMQPFSSQRDGLYLGEGCGAVVLSSTAGSESLCYAGAANIGDNFSITASNPDGSVVAETIKRALKNAEITAGDIKLVKAHGTASLSSDDAESAGLDAVFSKENIPVPPLACFKPYIGHTLGSCGIYELILFAKALKQGFDLPQQDIDESFPLRFARVEDYDAQGYYLLNYFGFGGNSTVLVIRNV